MKIRMLLAAGLAATALVIPGAAHASTVPNVNTWHSTGAITSRDNHIWCITVQGHTKTTIPGDKAAPASTPVVGSQILLAPCVKNDPNQYFFAWRIPNSGQINLVKWPHLCIAQVSGSGFAAKIIDCDKPGKYDSLITFVPYKNGWACRITVRKVNYYLTGYIPSKSRVSKMIFAKGNKNTKGQVFHFAQWKENPDT